MTTWIVQNLWLIPVLPLLAAGLLAVTSREHRQWAATVSIGAMIAAFVLACVALIATLGGHGHADAWQEVHCNIPWFQFGDSDLETVQIGWVLDPLTAVMLVMVTLVGTLIFIYSIGYMAHDDNFARFFCFLSLFAAAMLGVVIANSLLLLFICWELVGLSSYLLIGFWYHKPSAAAAAKKAFITTRVGDIGFLLGMLWLYSQTGTLLFYDHGSGCLEASALTKLVTATTAAGMAVSTAVALLIFCGAVGKSGQVPLHVWLPDAMEGPTPVSALIHAATMVAAGVFLVARMFPVFDADLGNQAGYSTALTAVTWVGSITAVFAASIAVAQTDIKRILAYSTVSQLGYMMMGLGVGGVAVGMFHLITHAFFKALLFMGAGSVIHGCHEEQDVRRMGGLHKFMPVTFYTYAVGMMALSGVPIFFSGFWSKDEILHSAMLWKPSLWPFYLGVFGALLTAFYMTRQVCYVFFGQSRLAAATHGSHGEHGHHGAPTPHESPAIMTLPLVVLAVFAVLLSVIGTPIWPWFHHYLSGGAGEHGGGNMKGVLGVMLMSAAIVAIGFWAGWNLYGRTPAKHADDPDPLERRSADVFAALRGKYYIDELYEMTVIKLNAWLARVSDWFDRTIWGGAVQLVSLVVLACAWVNQFFDEYVINFGFDKVCGRVRQGAGFTSGLQDGQLHNYLRVIGIALTVVILVMVWGCRAT